MPALVLDPYLAWLEVQPLARQTKRTYGARVRDFLSWLHTSSQDTPAAADPLADADAATYAIRDYKSYLKTRRASPRTVNLSLAALDHCCHHYLGLPRPSVRREDLPAQAPRALDPAAIKRFLRAAERAGEVRDRAIVHLLLNTGLRLSELVGLDREDVQISGRKGRVIVRCGKGDRYREVDLNAAARAALDPWLTERARRYPDSGEPALFLARSGQRLSARSVDAILRKIGHDAQVAVSDILRHTFVTSLVRAGADIVLVAELAGHARLETTRRYALPSAEDRAATIEGLDFDY